MLVLTAAGVMFSTFLNGAVAMLATMAAMIAGFFIPFMTQLAAGTLPGGKSFSGPRELKQVLKARRAEFLARVGHRLESLGWPRLTATFVAHLTVARRV